MKKIIIALCIVLPSIAFAGDKPHSEDVNDELIQLSIQDSQCHDGADSTVAMKMCQDSYYRGLDQILNREYKAIMNGDSEKEVKDRFRQSQRDWIKFRESNCSWQASQMLGGTGEGVIANGCYNSMLELRIKEMMEFFYSGL